MVCDWCKQPGDTERFRDYESLVLNCCPTCPAVYWRNRRRARSQTYFLRQINVLMGDRYLYNQGEALVARQIVQERTERYIRCLRRP